MGRLHFTAFWTSLTSLAALGAVSCGTATPPSHTGPVAHLEHATFSPGRDAEPVTASEARPKEAARDAALDWVLARLPARGHAERNADGILVVTHEVQPKETAASIAKAYLPLSDIYLSADLAATITKESRSLKVGSTITIPEPVQLPYGTPEEERLPWPADKKLRAIYLGGRDALGSWEGTLDRMQARGMKLIILDAKEYMGGMTYASKVDVAVRTGATKGALIEDLARSIRFAHKRGVLVSMRIACFHDPLSAEKAPELSIKGSWGGPYPIGWLDPGDAKAQKYIFDLIDESLAMGADEINLDYIRYPVQGGLGNADFHLKDTGRTTTGVIRDFAHAAHAMTQKHKAALSLDLFGVTAIGTQQDIDGLGQDIGMLGPEAEALMPMVYPSHYGKGFYGWDIPGNHPEIVGIGTKAAIAKLNGKTDGAVIRPWVQASNWNTPDYSPKYLHDECTSGEQAGGAGWAMWNPGGFYGDAWRAFEPKK